MIRTSVVSVLTIGLLAGSAVGVGAQDEDAAVGLGTPVYLTGTVGEPGSVMEGTISEDNRVLRDFVYEAVPVESSDPRLTGLLDIAINGHSEVAEGSAAILESRSYRLVNDSGSWVGTGNYVQAGVPGAEAPHIQRETALFAGEGGYAGLVAYMTIDHREGEPWEAVVFGVEAPPVPEPPAE